MYPKKSNGQATDNTKKGANHKPPNVKSLKETNYNKKCIKASKPKPPVTQSNHVDVPEKSYGQTADDTKRSTNHKPPQVKPLKETNYNKKSIKASDPKPPATQSSTEDNHAEGSEPKPPVEETIIKKVKTKQMNQKTGLEKNIRKIRA